MGYIYKIYNDFDDKIYIGKTTRTVEQRFIEHYNNTSGSNSYIDYSMKKYGLQHFAFEIIEECDAEQLNQRERYWVQYYNCQYPLGYNLTPGGDGISLSDKQISDIRLLWENGKSVTEISNELHLSRSTVYHRICNYKDFDRKENLVRSMKNQYKPITLYDKLGKKIKDFNSITEASKELQISDKQISQGLSTHYLVHNYRFAYKGEELKIQTNKKPVMQFNLEGEYLRTFEGARVAARELNIDSGSIIKVCNGKQKSSKGYIFIYEQDYSDALLQLKVQEAYKSKGYRMKEYQ